jgi:hypothetical protein
VNALLAQLLLPPRLLLRACDDLHRMAVAAVSIAATIRQVREEAVGLRDAVGPLRDDMDALRAAFAGADAELEALRKAFVPEVGRARAAVDALHEDVQNMPTS